MPLGRKVKKSFNAIDLAQRMRIFDAMRELKPDLTGILITHDAEIARKCDRVYQITLNLLEEVIE